jgi:phospholipase C
MRAIHLRRAVLSLATVSLAGCGGGATIGNSEPGVVGSPGVRASSTPSGLSSSAPGSMPGPQTSSAPGVSSVAACTPPSVLAGVTGPPADSPVNSPVGKIEHIVIIIQENRTFDNIFHGFSEPSGAKADYAEYGCGQNGQQLALASIPFENLASFNNSHAIFEQEYDNGKMDGFYAANGATQYASTANYGISYLPQTEVQPYFDMATSGALAERYFHGTSAPTYPSHLAFVAGSTTFDASPAHRVIANPTGLSAGCGDPNKDTVGVLDTDNPTAAPVVSCFTGVQTITDLLDDAGVGWQFYAFPTTLPDEPAVGVLNEGYGYDGMYSYAQDYAKANFAQTNLTPSESFIANAQTSLAPVTWVTPDGLDTDHPGGSTTAGPAWVEACVDAVGESRFYSNTAIFVTWDDWGGLYDHVVPQQKYAPYGLGFRIPLIAISPYARTGTLIDTQLEPGSLLRFIEETFGLPSLGRQDATANSVDDMFDFSKAPAAFTPIVSASKRYPASYFLHRTPSGLPIDDDLLGPRGGS